MKTPIFVIKKLLTISFCCILLFSSFIPLHSAVECSAMPFFNLQPKEIVLRAKFSTCFSSSSKERKSNIKLASRALNNTLVDVGEEFSFNHIVGERTEKRGYKSAKIIVNGDFVDGVGGGVCQVSTTLYNALLLAGMKITEYHPHSLQVSYVLPSFDAMVNSSYADLKFENNTNNPIIICANATDSNITIEIYGEPLCVAYERKSVTTDSIIAPFEEVFDYEGLFPDLFEGESKVIKFGKDGIKSEGYLIIKRNGEVLKTTKIRTDKYNPIKTVIMHGTAKKEQNVEDISLSQ